MSAGAPPIVDVSAPRPAGARLGDWGLTFTGRQFWPQDPRPGDVDVLDVAHALALQARFAGHTREPYSIAQHSVLVSQACRREHALIGLLHDATEAYLQDLIRPLKRAVAALYKPLERQWAWAIGMAFGLGDALVDLPDDVEAADRLVLVAERRDLLAPRAWPAELAWADSITPWPWQEAERRFLERFTELRGPRP